MNIYIDTHPTLGEWIEKPNDITYHRRYCDTVFGRYTIAILCGKYELLLHGFVTYSFDPYDTFDQAKAAAQADYEARTAERFRKVEVPDCFEADEFLNSKDIYHHPYITDRTDSESYSVAELMAQFFEWYIDKATTPESLHTKP
jgi:hypothetical protein